MPHSRQTMDIPYDVMAAIIRDPKKYDKIVQGLSGPAFNGKLFVKKAQVEFLDQFRSYPDVSHDDLIETVAIAVAELSGPGYEDDAYADMMHEEDDIPRLSYERGAP